MYDLYGITPKAATGIKAALDKYTQSVRSWMKMGSIESSCKSYAAGPSTLSKIRNMDTAIRTQIEEYLKDIEQLDQALNAALRQYSAIDSSTDALNRGVDYLSKKS